MKRRKLETAQWIARLSVDKRGLSFIRRRARAMCNSIECICLGNNAELKVASWERSSWKPLAYARLQINRRALVGKSENLAAICLWERVWGCACAVRHHHGCIMHASVAAVRNGMSRREPPVAASTQGEDITNANHLISMLIETPTHLYRRRSRARSLTQPNEIYLY